MTDESAPATGAGPDVVAAPVADEPVVLKEPAEAQEDEGQPEGQAAEGEEPEDKKREGRKDRRERDRAYKARLREEREEAIRRAERAEALLQQRAKEAPPPREADFATLEAYDAAKTKWAAKQAISEWETEGATSEAQAARKQVEEIAAQEKQVIAEAWADQVSQARVRYPDFERVALDNTVPIAPHVAEILVASDVGADLAYHLGRNRGLAAEISKMPPIEAARAIGRLEATLSGPRPKTETSAPPPISPVKAGAAVARDPSKMTAREFAKWREEGGTF